MRIRAWAPLAALAVLGTIAPSEAEGALPKGGQRYFGATSQRVLVVAQAAGSRRRLDSLDLDVVARCRGRDLARRMKEETLYMRGFPLRSDGAFSRTGRLLRFNSGPSEAGVYPVRVSGRISGRFATSERLTGTADLILQGRFYLGGGSGEGFSSERATCHTGPIRFSARAPRDARSHVGALTEVASARGCVFARRRRVCTHAPLVGAPDEILISRDGRHVYALSSDGEYRAWVVGFRRNARTGALRAIGGDGACVRAEPAPGCTVLRGLDDVSGATLSPDGRFAYVIGTEPPAIAVLARDRRTGRFSQLSGSAGCVGAVEDGCAPLPALGDVSGVEVSPDGRQLYLAFDGSTTPSDRGLMWLPRRRDTGALGPMAPHGCISALGRPGCRRGPFTRTPVDVTLARDGDNVYATLLGGAVMALHRTAASGALRPLPEPNTCYFAEGRNGCRSRGDDDGQLVLSADGRSAYYMIGSGVAALARRPTGALDQLRGQWACVGGEETAGCRPSRGLDFPNAITLSPDGRNLYVGNYGDGLAVVFRRVRGGGLMQLSGSAGCLVGLHGSPIPLYRPYRCRRTLLADEVNAIASSPDGRHVYLASGYWPDYGGLHLFRRRAR
jgi:DNA-binding beta-propeller fold protein YncE